MDIFKASEKLMGMDDASWARHANPWSVYTRIAGLPLLVLSLWSRDWIGWWCLVPLVLSIAFIWWNPRAFEAPADTENWASHGTLGERVFLDRKAKSIPGHHERAAYLLTFVSAAGLVPLIYGLIVLSLPWTMLGLVLMIFGKLWFVDRMVWLYRDMRGQRSDRLSGS